MIVPREVWNKLESRITYNTSNYTKLKLKVVEVLADSTTFRLPYDAECADYVFKVRKDENGNLYFNYFHKQFVKKDIIFADLDYFTMLMADLKEPK